MTIIYLFIILFILWLIVGALMIIIKLILAFYEFYNDLKTIITNKKRG